MNPKHLFPILSILTLLAASLACNIPGSSVTPTAIETTYPLESPTNTDIPATPTESSSSVLFSGVSFTIPANLGSIGASESIAAMDNEGGPGWDTAPAYTKFTLKDYPLSNSALEPKIYVYPATEYETVNSGAAESLKRLRALLASTKMEINKQTAPFIPFFNATPLFETQSLRIKFQNGAGIRILTQYEQAPMPVNNHDAVYQFEGLTSDGKYYVIALLPISSPTLQADSSIDSSVPSGGIPFNESDPAAYFDAVSQNLNNAAPESFTPTLTSLDALIASIKVTAP